MLLGPLALLVAGLFAGASFYVSYAEQPARLVLDDRAQLLQWKPALARGTVMQLPLTVIGFLLGLGAWWQTGHALWGLGGLLMIANGPYTARAILPINRRLKAMEPTAAGPESTALIARWGALHNARTALGLAAALVFLWASVL